GGLLRLDESGLSMLRPNSTLWVNVGQPVPAFTRSLVVIGGSIFASSRYGIFRLDHLGSQWKRLEDGPGTLEVTSIAESNGFVVAGTTGGIFQSEDSGCSWKFQPQ